MRYMIIVESSRQHYDAIAGRQTDVPTWSPQEIEAMYGFVDRRCASFPCSDPWFVIQSIT